MTHNRRCAESCATAKAVCGHSVAESTMTMAIVAIPVTLPLVAAILHSRVKFRHPKPFKQPLVLDAVHFHR